MNLSTVKNLALATIITLVLSSCGGGPTEATKAVKAAEVELNLTPYELENIDLDKNPEYEGKIVQIDATIIRIGNSTPEEAKFGDYFVYVECEKGPNDQFTPRFNCYTPINYKGTSGQVTIKGRAYQNGIIYDCVVSAK